MMGTDTAIGYRKGLKQAAYNTVHEADDAGKRALLEAALFQVRIAARCLLEPKTESKPTEAAEAILNYAVNAAWGIEGLLQAADVLLTGPEPDPGRNARYVPLPHPLEDQDGEDRRRFKP